MAAQVIDVKARLYAPAAAGKNRLAPTREPKIRLASRSARARHHVPTRSPATSRTPRLDALTPTGLTAESPAADRGVSGRGVPRPAGRRMVTDDGDEAHRTTGSAERRATS